MYIVIITIIILGFLGWFFYKKKKKKKEHIEEIKEKPIPNIRWIRNPKLFKEELEKIEEIISKITIILEEEEFKFELSSKGKTILNAAIDEGIDVSFLCKNGVCQTCKARLLEGKIIMNGEWCELADEEIEEGDILLCQSHPTSENVIIECEKRTFFD